MLGVYMMQRRVGVVYLFGCLRVKSLSNDEGTIDTKSEGASAQGFDF